VDPPSRDMASACTQMEVWLRQGIQIMLLDLPITPGTDWDAAAMCCFHMLMTFSQFERRRLRERSLRSKRALQARGSTQKGRRLFGYAIERIGPREREL